MKAYVLHNVNDLKYEDIEEPTFPSKDWALVKVRAAGICSSDIPRIYFKGTYHFPTIPGHEFSGQVVKVGDDQHNGYLNKKVGIFPLIPCKKCKQCADKHFEMCSNYDYLGSRRNGGFAEYVVVPIWNLIVLPDSISFQEAALLEPLAVALHSAKRANIKKGSTVAVVGTGMIGLCVGQWAYKLGAQKVIVIGRNENKRNIVEHLGLTFLTELQNDTVFDVVIEAVGSTESINQSISIVAPSGSLVLMGNPPSDILLDQNIYWRILRKQLIVTGTWNSSYNGALKSDWTEAVDAITKNEIKVDNLISHIFKQHQLKEGLELMRNHEQPYCKVMTVWNE